MDVDGDVEFHSSTDVVTGQNAGTLTVGGDFIVSGGEHCYQPYGGHITEFKGAKEHKVYFSSSEYNNLNNIQIGVGDTLKFTGQLSGVAAKGGEITVDPANIADVAELSVKGIKEGKGEIKFANDKKSVTKELTVVKSDVAVEVCKGDINGDGIVNAVDASRVLVIYAELTAGGDVLTAELFTVCDINMDGNVNAVDASLILAYYASLAADPTLTLDGFIADKLKK